MKINFGMKVHPVSTLFDTNFLLFDLVLKIKSLVTNCKLPFYSSLNHNRRSRDESIVSTTSLPYSFVQTVHLGL